MGGLSGSGGGFASIISKSIIKKPNKSVEQTKPITTRKPYEAKDVAKQDKQTSLLGDIKRKRAFEGTGKQLKDKLG